eukprot:Platyproteum_vivax@DN10922_c0_g1_i1.p1
MSNNVNNRPEAGELLHLPSGVNRVEYTPDQKLPYTGYFTIWLEDHSVGNLIRTRLLESEKDVRFAGYKVPHPLENKLLLRVQTRSIDPREITDHALTSLRKEVEALGGAFDAAVLKFNSDRQVAEEQQMAENFF